MNLICGHVHKTWYSVGLMATEKHNEKREGGSSSVHNVPAIVDASTNANAAESAIAAGVLFEDEKSARRKAQYRESKKRTRQAAKEAGERELRVTITEAEFQLLCECHIKQKGPLQGFYGRALILGAKFLANSGQPRGKKVKGGAQ